MDKKSSQKVSNSFSSDSDRKSRNIIFNNISDLSISKHHNYLHSSRNISQNIQNSNFNANSQNDNVNFQSPRKKNLNFKAFGREFTLELSADSVRLENNFRDVANSRTLTNSTSGARNSKNVHSWEEEGEDESDPGCFYSGFLAGRESESSVSVNLCGGGVVS